MFEFLGVLLPGESGKFVAQGGPFDDDLKRMRCGVEVEKRRLPEFFLIHV